MPYIGTSPSNSVRRVHTYTATASQTTFSGASSEGVTLSYVDANYIDVFQNGVLLGSADYTSTSGTSVVLAQGASADDLIVIVVYDVFSVADTVSKTNGGSFDSAVTMSDNLTVSGAFTSQGIDDNADATAITIDSSENVGLGTTSPSQKLDVVGSSANIRVAESGGGDLRMNVSGSTGGIGTHSNHHLLFRTNSTERMRIQDNGNFMVGTTNQSPAEGTTTGTRIGGNGATQFSADGQTSVIINRVQDGRVVALHSAGTLEGEIGISGTTTTYGGFTGTHWSRLTDNSQPTILKGTILETIDEMCDWYQAEITVPKTDDEDEYKVRQSIALPSGKKVGDTISHTYNGVTYDDALIVKEDDDKHTKCKISDTADSKSVYGVFCDWDTDDDTINDMKIASLGTHVVRVNKDVTVSKGDLLVSNGDGTAKVQDDDIIRSKTIGKVLTNIKQETYDDGSYTVPCALYCG